MTRRQESLAHDAKNEMYSEQRSQMRHAKTESRSYSSTSTEAQEWQSMVKSEARKSAVSYATSSHFDMVSQKQFHHECILQRIPSLEEHGWTQPDCWT